MDDKSRKVIFISIIVIAVLAVILLFIYISAGRFGMQVKEPLNQNISYYYANGSFSPNATNVVLCKLYEFDTRCHALATGDYSVCADVIDPYLQAQCAEHISWYQTILASSVSDCSKISNQTFKQMCTLKIEKDLAGCSALPGDQDRKECQLMQTPDFDCAGNSDCEDGKIIIRAIQTRDKSLCSQVKNTGFTKPCLGYLTKDIEVCRLNPHAQISRNDQNTLQCSKT